MHTTAVQPVATCRQSPYLNKPAIVIVTPFSLWRLAPTELAALAAPVLIRYWAGHANRYGRMDTLPRL